MRKIFVVDSAVLKKFPEKFPKDSLSFPFSEKNKTMKTVLKLAKKLNKIQIDRSNLLVAVGGGNALDTVGFLASIYLRGVKWIAMPTTLLAMADVSLGGKTGINFEGAKNQIGTFYPPCKTKIDTDFLQSLTQKEFSNGMAEIIKHALIVDKRFFNFLGKNAKKILAGDKKILEQIINKSREIKKKIVDIDPFEKNKRKLLNFGHTYAHAIEKISKHTIPHGEAVSLGIILINDWAQKHYGQDRKIQKHSRALLNKFSLPTSLPKNISESKLREEALADKKKIGEKIDLVILEKIGSAKIIRDSNFFKC